MIEIKPNALYSRTDIVEMLSGFRINPDAFIARIKPVKRFRHAWYGQDLLDAIAAAPPMLKGEHEEEQAVVKPRRGRPRKGERRPGLIGEWTPEELGL